MFVASNLTPRTFEILSSVSSLHNIIAGDLWAKRGERSIFFIYLFIYILNIFIDNHVEQLHLQSYKKNTLTIDINRVKQN